ncbi:uncharacterized protein LOC8275351 [Ricinus communis]|uniref:Uncharacterized protein n=1 Tax=Ricinus communis TaxID=3988 RepID=B9RY47_RICCO|nr:uncharacterized protein LOC8275351 [Ricinus communis]XP_015574385.1 uncharacterized protein LOC8275351 [Ricinus communis]XP_015574386.1 uncharacterized protein LOC8275351 [Ricinus communis]EEF43739.1 conserved hypothetical protein [Ricinus communis]|eukprot:XP_015574384.2 uncharacterized protein LOC8275351 [Ricinus communis]
MAAESNSGFYALASALNRHAISFQSEAINSSSEMIPMASGSNYFGMNNTATTSSSVMLPGGANSTTLPPPGIPHVNSCASSLLLDSAPGLKHDTGLAVEWSVDEQIILEEGLSKFADEPSIMRYIKIAATLRDKTVRDVALRCRWMTRKRRKADEYNLGKKVNNRKDKLVESSSKMNVPSALPQNMALYPLMMHHPDQGEPLSFEGISGTSRHLLEQNVQAFSKITANLSTFKLQDNIDLFCRTRTNITAILNDMRGMPGIMSQMPPLPVSINEDLANSILPSTTQSMMFCSPSGIQLKQEPRC